jgi:tetratricopeptide (TPR) repeat protein
MTRASLSLAVLVLLGMAAAAPARADDRSEARAHYDKATAAYALGRYADAAVEFEQAFSLKPDPAILYNAAQANRLAGKKERALELYKNYRRVYGRRADHAPDVDRHIAELEKAVENDRRVSSAESTSLANPDGPVPPASPTMPAPQVTQPVPAAPPPAPSSAPPAALVTQQPATPVDEERPVYTRWWFWTVGGAVVAGAVVGVVLMTRPSADCGPGVDYCANTGL